MKKLIVGLFIGGLLTAGIGISAVANSTCEPAVIRQTTYTYQYCRDLNGNAGLTASGLKK